MSATIRLVEIAEILGVSKQRVQQLVADEGSPSPVDQDARGRLWNRRQIETWAKKWRAERPWR